MYMHFYYDPIHASIGLDQKLHAWSYTERNESSLLIMLSYNYMHHFHIYMKYIINSNFEIINICVTETEKYYDDLSQDLFSLCRAYIFYCLPAEIFY